MISILVIYIFCLGLIIGSFLNVVALRYNTGKTIGGRSMCFSCRKTLRWYELVPFFSFVLQSGRCKGCKSKISWQYPLGEVATGLLFVGSFLHSVSKYDLSPQCVLFTIIYCIASCLLMVILIYDIKHKIIPDRLALFFALLGLAVAFFQKDFSIMRLLAGPIVALPFYLIWQLSKGRLMGLGDAKLMVGMGWMLGLGGAVNAIVLAFWAATLVALPLLLGQKFGLRYGRNRLTIKSEIPFAPFLILGLYLVLFFSINVFPYVFTL